MQHSQLDHNCSVPHCSVVGRFQKANFLILRQIIKKVNKLQIEAILHIVSKFQFNHSQFQRVEASVKILVGKCNKRRKKSNE